jgi:K+-transporting ATPase ATPase A chain
MNINHIIIFLSFVFLLFGSQQFFGNYLFYIFEGKMQFLKKIEELIFKSAAIDPFQEMTPKRYLSSLLLFNFFGFLTLFLILILQPFLPLNAKGAPYLEVSLALNIAISFVTNTNWQSFAPETELSYFSQIVGCGVQNFLSAATSITLFLAFARGIKRRSSETLGNFWQDVVKIILYVLLPVSMIFSLFFVSQGAINNYDNNIKIKTLEGAYQEIPMGPSATIVSIKQLGSNGGGFFNVNSAHPFENPNEITNFFQLYLMLLIPASLPFAYGRIVGSKKGGWMIFLAMFLLWLGSFILSVYFEIQPNPLLDAFPLLEGKEMRFGVLGSIFWSTLTTATSTGSINAMLDSLSPMSGGLALFNILLGELAFGGAGTGFCYMMMYILTSAFFCGLLIGRSPDYLGKKIEIKELTLISFALLIPSILILFGGGVSTFFPGILSNIQNKGPHGLTELIWAFASTASNNGSAFAGFNASTVVLNIVLAFVMLLTRLSVVVPTILVAGLFAKKNALKETPMTSLVESPIFLILLLSFIIIFTLLSFFPVLCLGPIVENILMQRGVVF